MTHVLLIFESKLYRCAGYRFPLPGEIYVSKDAKIKKSDKHRPPAEPRLIVREVTIAVADVPGQEHKR